MNKYNINKWGDKIVPCIVCQRPTQDFKDSTDTICMDCAGYRIDFKANLPIIDESSQGESHELQGKIQKTAEEIDHG